MKPRVAFLHFPVPAHPLSINESNRLHWAQRRKRLHPWRQAALLAWRTQVDDWALSPVSISVTIPFDRGARRDAHNYTSTVVKSIVDGLIEAGLCPDDTPEWVQVNDPTLVVDPNAEVLITIIAQEWKR